MRSPTLDALTPVIPEPSPMNIPAKESAVITPDALIFLNPEISLLPSVTRTLFSDASPNKALSNNNNSSFERKLSPPSKNNPF